MGLSTLDWQWVDVLLAQSKPHDLSKSDLETTFNVSALTSAQQRALQIELPEMKPLSMVRAILSHGLDGMKPLVDHSTASLRRYFELEARVASLNKNGGKTLIEDFFANTVPKREITYYPGTSVSVLVENNDRIKAVMLAFEKDFTTRYQELLNHKQASVNIEYLDSEFARFGGHLYPPETPFFGVGDPLAILGSFQQIDVRLVGWKQGTAHGYQALLRYELYDHFGCDDSDLTGLPTHGTPGQIAMWLLARKPAHAPGNKPFVVKVEVERIVSPFTAHMRLFK